MQLQATHKKHIREMILQFINQEMKGQRFHTFLVRKDFCNSFYIHCKYFGSQCLLLFKLKVHLSSYSEAFNLIT